MMDKGSLHPVKTTVRLHFCIALLALSVPWIVREKRQAQVSTAYSEKEWDVVTITDDYHFSFGEYEDKPLLDSLRRMGRKATRVSIQDETFDFNSTKAIVIRSAWGKYHYLDHYHKFLDDMEQNPTLSLLNPGALFNWHGKKSIYLKQLAEYGINIPETYWVHGNVKTIPNLRNIAQELGCEKMVMKPASGNAGHGVKLVTTTNMVMMQDHLYLLVRGYERSDDTIDTESLNDEADFIPGPKADDVMIQCFQKYIKTRCERGVVLIGGEVTHGVKKCPGRRGFLVHEAYGGTTDIYDPSTAEIKFAKKVAQAVKDLVGEPAAYLRVDVITDNEGNLALMELAAGTAQLWLSQTPQAADVFAAYLDDYLRQREVAGLSYGTKESDMPVDGNARPRFLVEDELEDIVETVEEDTTVLIWSESDEKYFEGRVIEILHGTDLWLWRIQYEEGDIEWLEPLQKKHRVYLPITKGGHQQQFVSVENIKNGTSVWVWWDPDERYYEGSIIDIKHSRLGTSDEWYWRINYDDGDEEWLDALQAKIHIPRTTYNLQNHYVDLSTSQETRIIPSIIMSIEKVFDVFWEHKHA